MGKPKAFVKWDEGPPLWFGDSEKPKQYSWVKIEAPLNGNQKEGILQLCSDVVRKHTSIPFPYHFIQLDNGDMKNLLKILNDKQKEWINRAFTAIAL